MSLRVILLTGVTRGCGRALLDRFSEAGHTVVGCGRDTREVERLRSDFPAPHRFDPVDVADDAAVRDWAAETLASHGPPDLLLNNAAIINRSAALWELDAGEFDRVIDVNIKGVANVIRHFVPAMLARGTGIVVNFSSGWGRSTSAEVAPYCATKWAIEGLSQAMAQELPPGMASIPLNPGIINTEMLQSCWADGANSFPTPGVWSRTAAPFLLSLTPRHNGQPLSVPG